MIRNRWNGTGSTTKKCMTRFKFIFTNLNPGLTLFQTFILPAIDRGVDRGIN